MDNNVTKNDVLDWANQAMYEVKESRRNKICFFDQDYIGFLVD